MSFGFPQDKIHPKFVTENSWPSRPKCMATFLWPVAQNPPHTVDILQSHFQSHRHICHSDGWSFQGLRNESSSYSMSQLLPAAFPDFFLFHQLHQVIFLKAHITTMSLVLLGKQPYYFQPGSILMTAITVLSSLALGQDKYLLINQRIMHMMPMNHQDLYK